MNVGKAEGLLLEDLAELLDARVGQVAGDGIIDGRKNGLGGNLLASARGGLSQILELGPGGQGARRF